MMQSPSESQRIRKASLLIVNKHLTSISVNVSICSSIQKM